MTDWSDKQYFLNTVYERFFQGYSVKLADTMGIVYTPQEIVDMLNREVLKTARSPAVREKLSNVGVEPLVMTPTHFKTYVENEIALNAALAKNIGLKAE